ncbi:MAG: zinc-finger domain-containing protein [Proteobacteria bacterium]|nr:zinc-finger domain-containing protein [Pseudomonadota bacterium]
MSDTAKSFDAPETIEVEEHRVACDGGGALGHPKVYLEMGDENFVECPYCDRRFVLKAGAQTH